MLVSWSLRVLKAKNVSSQRKGSSLTGVTAVCLRARNINPCLVLVKHSKFRLDITHFLPGCKESNQKYIIEKQSYHIHTMMNQRKWHSAHR